MAGRVLTAGRGVRSVLQEYSGSCCFLNTKHEPYQKEKNHDLARLCAVVPGRSTI